MGCEIIDLQEYRDLLEQREMEAVEILAKEVRAALEEIGPPDELPFLIHDHPQVDTSMLYDLSPYSYFSSAPSLYEYGHHCPHCGKHSSDLKGE